MYTMLFTGRWTLVLPDGLVWLDPMDQRALARWILPLKSSMGFLLITLWGINLISHIDPRRRFIFGTLLGPLLGFVRGITRLVNSC
jgi:hypothetical protein